MFCAADAERPDADAGVSKMAAAGEKRAAFGTSLCDFSLLALALASCAVQSQHQQGEPLQHSRRNLITGVCEQ